jgi:hypothetical protein
MYVVRFNGKKLSLKAFAGLTKYEQARNALRKYLRSKGLGRIHGQLGYSIARV